MRDGIGRTVREVACYAIAAVGVINEDHVFAVLAEGSKARGRPRPRLHGFKFGDQLAVLADFEVLMLRTVLVDDEQLRLVDGMKREPRGHLMRHVGLREILDRFVLAVPGDGVH